MTSPEPQGERMYDAGWRAAVAWFDAEVHKDGDEYRDLPEIINDALTPR